MSRLLALAVSLLLAACSDSNNSFTPAPVLPDFTEADAWMADFVATEDAFPGGSYIVVDRDQGRGRAGAEDRIRIAVSAGRRRL